MQPPRPDAALDEIPFDPITDDMVDGANQRDHALDPRHRLRRDISVNLFLLLRRVERQDAWTPRVVTNDVKSKPPQRSPEIARHGKDSFECLSRE